MGQLHVKTYFQNRNKVNFNFSFQKMTIPRNLTELLEDLDDIDPDNLVTIELKSNSVITNST